MESKLNLNAEQQAALRNFMEVYDRLDGITEAKILDMRIRLRELPPTDFDAHRELWHELQNWSDDALGIIRSGPDRGMERHWMDLERAGIQYADFSETPEYDTVRKAVNKFTDTLKRFRDEMDSTKIKKLKDHGRAVLKNADSLRPEEMAQAVYWKHGIAVDTARHPMIVNILDYIENRNLPKLLAFIGHNSLNPASQEVFERITGKKLARTQTERIRQLSEWAGPDAVQAIRAEREAKNADIPLQNLRERFRELQSLNIGTVNQSGKEEILGGQDYIKSSVMRGFTDTFSRKNGATVQYGLRDPAEAITRTVKDRRITQFIKAVRDVDSDGRIAPALAKIGVQWAMDMPVAQPDEPDGPDDPALDSLWHKGGLKPH